MNLKDIDYVTGLKSNLHTTFESPQGKEVMRFLERIGGWYPTNFDSMETNDIISRDANRRMLATIKTIMELKPEQIVMLAQEREG